MPKLTKRQTEAILKKYTGERGQVTKLAKEYGVTKSRISQIVKVQRERTKLIKAGDKACVAVAGMCQDLLARSEADFVY